MYTYNVAFGYETQHFLLWLFVECTVHCVVSKMPYWIYSTYRVRTVHTVHTLSTVCPVYIGCTLHTVRTVCTVCTVHTVCTASKLRTACTVRKLCTLCTVCTVCTYAQYTHYAQYAQYSPQTSLHHSHISTAINQSIHSHTTDITDIIPVNTNSSINTFCCAVLMMIEVGRNM